jgi:hypothetical protein
VRFDHSLEVARSQLEAVAPLVSGDPETAIENLIDDPARRLELDELTDAEILRRTGARNSDSNRNRREGNSRPSYIGV